MNFNSVKQTLEESFNKEKSADVDIDINVTVLSGEHGKFSVAIHNGDCSITNSHLDKADITVGFINEETMLEMFIQGANPMSLVMGGKMTVNGDLKKGKEIKGLFVN